MKLIDGVWMPGAAVKSVPSGPETPAESQTANPTASKVLVNGAEISFEAYTINGENYFKLRDVAYAIKDTGKKFEAGYDSGTKAIALTSGKAYTPDGSELKKGDGAAKTAAPTASRIYVDGKEAGLTVYTISGNNFFRLRDVCRLFNIGVGYDSATKNITVDTSKPYTE